MAKLVLTDARLFVGYADLSGWSNQIELNDEFEDKEVTNWRSGGAKEYLAGLEKFEANAEGQWEAGDPGKIDDAMWARRRDIEAWSVGPSGTSDTTTGGLMYVGQAVRTSAQLFGQVGDVAPWKLSAAGSGALCRGYCLHPSGTARSASGSGTAVQLGAVAAGKQLRCNLHVLSVSGTDSPTLTAVVQSDSSNGFGSPTTVASFTAATAVTDQSILVDGPLTDDWFRVNWTISGTGPSFLFLVTVGIS